MDACAWGERRDRLEEVCGGKLEPADGMSIATGDDRIKGSESLIGSTTLTP